MNGFAENIIYFNTFNVLFVHFRYCWFCGNLGKREKKKLINGKNRTECNVCWFTWPTFAGYLLMKTPWKGKSFQFNLFWLKYSLSKFIYSIQRSFLSNKIDLIETFSISAGHGRGHDGVQVKVVICLYRMFYQWDYCIRWIDRLDQTNQWTRTRTLIGNWIKTKHRKYVAHVAWDTNLSYEGNLCNHSM